MNAFILTDYQLLLLITAGIIIAAFVYALFKKCCGVDEAMGSAGRLRSKTHQMAERRRTRRIQAGTVLELKDESGQPLSGTATLHDMSPKGACFDSAVVLKRKQKILALMRSTKHEGILELPAQVVWKHSGKSSHLYGVQFLSA